MPRTYRIEATIVVHELDEDSPEAGRIGETSLSEAADPAPCSFAPLTPEEIRAKGLPDGVVNGVQLVATGCTRKNGRKVAGRAMKQAL